MGYALIVAVLSLAGAALPLRRRPGHAQIQIYLSLAAGALLGAALFHLLPEASEHIGESFGLPAVLGIGVVFFLQRYIAPHSHEPPHVESHEGVQADGGHGHDHPHRHDGDDGHEESDDQHEVDHRDASRPRAGSIVGVLSLSIHSFFDGVAIGAVAGGQHAPGSVALAVSLSVLIHKPMDGLSVSVLLLNAGVKPRRLWLIQFVYAALVPAGALAFAMTRGAVADPSPLVGYTLAFSAGTFLAIALTDLLPELHFHAHDRNKLSAALLLGLLVMWLTSLIGHPGSHADVHASPTADSPVDHGH